MELNIETEEQRRKREFLEMQQNHIKLEMEKVKKLLEGAHMSISLSIHLFSEAEGILEDNNQRLDNNMLEAQRVYTHAADKYCKIFASMIKTDLEKRNYWQNLEAIEKKYKSWIGIEKSKEGWQSCDSSLPVDGKQVIVVTNKGNYRICETENVNGNLRWKTSNIYAKSIVAWKNIEKYIE